MAITIKHNKGTAIIPLHRTRCNAIPITNILPTGAWKGRTCFLIAGGPGLEDFNFNCIRNQLSIGINKSFIKFPTTVNYAMDTRFYDLVTFSKKDKNLHQQWLEYKGIKVFLRQSIKTTYDTSVYYVPSFSTGALSLDLKQGIWGGNNSGFGALMLAIALGCRRIGLLGYALKVREIQGKIETHWHGGYGHEKVDTYQKKLDKFRKCIEGHADVITQQGIEVVNLDLDSALECFPKDTLNNFLSKSAK